MSILPDDKTLVPQGLHNNELVDDVTAKKSSINKGINDSLLQVFELQPQQVNVVNTIVSRYQLKHGLTASIPIICKSNGCPYFNQCRVPMADRVMGMLCLQEIGAITTRFEMLCNELEITELDAVDLGLVKDVVDIEITLLRIDNKMAESADVLATVFAAVDRDGIDHFMEAPHPLLQMKLSLLEKKMKILEKLNSTRKDKMDQMKKKKDPTIKSSTLVAKARMMSQFMKQQGASIDPTPVDVIQEQEISIHEEYGVDEDESI
jgi:hypothetical protein